MATLYITEYATFTPAGAPGGFGQIAQEPPLAEQTVAIGVGSVQSSAFNTNTRFVRLHVDGTGPCSVEFGTNPTASATTGRLAANQTEYRGVPKGQSFKVAVITNS